MDSYRTFIAIELPHALRARLIEHIQQLRRQLPDTRASWSREHNLHLTLKFLGNVPVSEVPKVSDAVARAVTAIKPFEITVVDCGVFPPRGRPNVLWIGVSSSPGPTPDNQELRTSLDAGFSRLPTPETSHLEFSQHPEFPRHSMPDARYPLFLLHSAIENECSTAGFPREQRAFHPHLTIARLRKHGDERRLAEAHQKFEFPPATVLVSEVVVFQSELLREGSKHTPISRHAFH